MAAPREVEFLIVGGGMAGAHCAAKLRDQGADGSILLAAREPHPPYERPPLSKEYLRGEAAVDDTYVNPASWYEENDVELLTGRNVMGLDPGERVAKLQGGDEVKFDKAMLGTGAMVNILRLDGAQLDGIHYLRALGNSDSIRDAAEGAEHVVLIGGSFIGTEVAASLTAKGTKCSIVMMEDVAFENVFGPEAGQFFDEKLTSNGVEIFRGAELEAFEGEGSVSAVRTKGGETIDCDAVVVGAGVRPDTMLAQKAGLEIGDGIVCDEKLETSAEGIYAAGDACSYESVIHGRRLRVEHWDVALNQGEHAAKNMLGADKPYEVIPYFFSDLADWVSLEYVGPAHEWDELVWRGDRDAGEFSAWYLHGGKVAAALSVERSDDLEQARRLIASGADISGSHDALADPGSDLEQLGG